MPLFSWYREGFLPGAPPPPTKEEEGFDSGCAWPDALAAGPGERGAYGGEIAAFFMRLNERRVAAAPPPAGRVVTFSHFLPRAECFFGWRGLGRVMGDPAIDAALRKLKASVHVCGHSHHNFDEDHAGVRYVQCALGYPTDDWTCKHARDRGAPFLLI